MPARALPAADHTVSYAVEAAGVVVTGTYRSTPEQVTKMVAGSRVSANAVAATLPAPGRQSTRRLAAATRVKAPGTFFGQGFDACAAPSSSTMDAWLSSPYRAVGVYIGGAARACAQPNLTADWVSRQSANGWHIFPIYVGLQAPCTTFANRIDPTQATTQGRAAGDDAANLAVALGMARGSVIIEDVEYYSGDAACSAAVLQYLSGWTARLHERGYRSSVYSSLSAGIADLVANYDNAAHTRPDQIDFASWDGVVTVSDAGIPDLYWADHQRIKQHTGDHDEIYGGVRINIDSNLLDVRQPVLKCAGCRDRGTSWPAR